jgi:hypothetical protein
MNRMIKALGGLFLAATLAACGGGGGSAGSTSTGGGTTTGGTSGTGGVTTTPGDTQTSTAGSIVLQIKSAAGADTTTIGGTEQARAVATVTGPTGAPIPGVIVVFSQADANLLAISPGSGTALTDAGGQASVDLKAADSTKTGAVTVAAQVLINGATLAAKKAIQITASSSTGVPEVPVSMLFLDANPTTIVIKGAGGAGRSESSTLRFKVVNGSNTPIKGAVVNFSISNPGVTLNITQATSDAEGVVITTITSGTTPTSVVVTATAAANTTVTVPSSALSVSNGLPFAAGFEIVAAKYNIDGGTTGTTTTVSAFLRDLNGNLVPDGTVVSFTTDNGAIGTSSAGSCSTINGTCVVPFRVQEPRGSGVATVRATVFLPGDPVALADSLQINMANSAGARALSSLSPATVATVITLGGTCKDTFTLYAADPANRALAAGSTIAAEAAGKGVTVSVASGSPVDDSLDAAFTPTSFRLVVDAGGALPACNALSATLESTTFDLVFKSPNGVTSRVPVQIVYPR